MSYSNVTYALIKPVENYVDSNWVRPVKTPFIKKHVLARGAHFVLAPASFITSAVDTIIGLGVGIGAICTLGKHYPTFKIAHNHLSGSRGLFVRPYKNLLQTINPEAKFSGDLANESHLVRQLRLAKQAKISGDGDGFLSDLVIDPLKDIARSCYNSDNFLKRHVASRLTYALLAISCLVTRVVDGIISIPVAGLSILTGGKFESLNNLAYRTLQAPGIINDLFYCTIKFINPWTGTSKT
jgi:hypothetical protein